MKGIVLAGGSGSRLHPITKSVSKQLLPVYDKPMIYYPLSVLMLAGIKDILIITTPKDKTSFETLLGNGSQLGISLTYKTQAQPNGIAEAFLIGEEFIGQNTVCLILGDNIFYGQGLKQKVQKAAELTRGSVIFGYYVKDPQRYGVAQFDKNLNVISIEEKPKTPKSNYAVTGLYFYDNDVINITKNLTPSKRGELEITDVNREYLRSKKIKLELLGRGFAWLDTGTCESLLEAANYIATIEKRQGLKIACLEEVAYQMEYISRSELKQLSKTYKKTEYGRYLPTIGEKYGQKQ